MTEARDDASAFSPLAARLAGLDAGDPLAVVEHLRRDVPAYAHHLSDDLTALALSPAL